MSTQKPVARAAVRYGTYGGFLSPLLLSGCTRSPVFNVLGSYFPGWIACVVLGIVVAVGIRAILNRLQWEHRIAALPLFYVSVAMAFACAFWLLAFE